MLNLSHITWVTLFESQYLSHIIWVTLLESHYLSHKILLHWLPCIFLTKRSYILVLHWLTLYSLENLSAIVGTAVAANRCCLSFWRHFMRSLCLFITVATFPTQEWQGCQECTVYVSNVATGIDQRRLNIRAIGYGNESRQRYTPTLQAVLQSQSLLKEFMWCACSVRCNLTVSLGDDSLVVSQWTGQLCKVTGSVKFCP